jgi:hypothetical protein
MMEVLAWTLCALGWALLFRLLRINEKLRHDIALLRGFVFTSDTPTQESEES